MRKTLLILTFVAAAIILASCEKMESDNPVTINLDGSTKMRIAMHVNPELGVHTGEVTISKGDMVYSQPLEFDNGNATVLFSDLQPGLWLVEVELRDEDDYVLYQGSGEAGVVGGQTNTATIVLEELSGDLEVVIEMPDSSPQPRVVFQSNREGGTNVFIMNEDGSEVQKMTHSGGYDPDWSPDGTKIAYTDCCPFNIYTMNADGSEIQQITDTPDRDVFPEWSPDGSQIVFSRKHDGQWQIYAMDPDGSNQQNLSNNTWDDIYPAWSPDGTKIAFQSSRDGNAEIYLMNTDGSNQTRLTDNPAGDSVEAWSPDGAKLIFTTNRDGNLEIYSINSDGSDPINLTNHPADDLEATWSSDGLRIAFSSHRSGNQEIYVMQGDGSDPINLTQNPASDSRPDWNIRSE